MPNLLLCMTPGVGLNTWKSIGSLKRELRPYVEYVQKGWHVKILTFDSDKIPELPKGMEAICFPHHRLLWLLPWTHKVLGSWADVIKTNQSYNAFFYTRAAKKWNKPILLRCGYVYGEYLESSNGLTPKVRLKQWIDAKGFRKANQCLVPTERLSAWIQKKYKVPKEQISVIPNFVDTVAFSPLGSIKKKERSIISVGRLHSIKRFDLLIRACAEIPMCQLTIVGEGPERPYLKDLASELNVNLELLGNVANEKLPNIILKNQIFAIVSKWEGHPKALIEAMACGIPCIGANDIGINNLIIHKINGLLVEANVRSIKDGIELFLNEKSLYNSIGKNARQFCVENYSAENVINKEICICGSLL